MIYLKQLTEVSNNSQLTNQVLIALNEKLDEKEKRGFQQWLQIVKHESDNNKISSTKNSIARGRFF